MGNLDQRSGAQVKIEIETLGTWGIFFFFEPYEPLSA